MSTTQTLKQEILQVVIVNPESEKAGVEVVYKGLYDDCVRQLIRAYEGLVTKGYTVVRRRTMLPHNIVGMDLRNGESQCTLYVRPAVSPLDIVHKAVHSYIASVCESLWGEDGSRGRGLRFSSGAIARLGAIFGWLDGVSQYDLLAGENLAYDIVCKQLDYLANYGGEIEAPWPLGPTDSNPDPKPIRLPSYVVTLGDDGTLHGFTLMWHKVVLTKDIKPEALSQAAETHFSGHFSRMVAKTLRAFNGGLLFHCNESNVYAVDLSNTKGPHWSIHT